MMEDVSARLQEFLENEARSCSMDFGCVTPLYVYRMWCGAVALEEIEKAMPCAKGLCLKTLKQNEGGI
jgi:hypothetical protein